MAAPARPRPASSRAAAYRKRFERAKARRRELAIERGLLPDE